MTDQQLQQLVEKISLRFFAKPFLHRAYFNGRLRTTGGRYHLETHNIDINPKMADMPSKTVLEGVIKHELCHYHLHLAGYSGKHNTKEFKQLLKAVGGLRYAPRVSGISPQAPKVAKYVYGCTHCGLTYRRQRRINIQKYVCGRCRGKLKLISTNG